MAKINKYGVRDLERDFPNDQKCLDFIFSTLHSKKCSCGGKYIPLKERRQYQCSKCRYQIAPTAGTIFHKSDTPLTLWFKVLLMFSNAKSGLSAKYLERELNVTYKTAWRMLKLIRMSLKQSERLLGGDIEMDETYFGGKGYAGKDNKLHSQAMKNKSVIIGALERNKTMRAEVSPNAKAKTIGKFLDKNINRFSTNRLITDKSNRYNKVAMGFDRHTVNHDIREFVRGDIHVNSLESFWSHIKRSIKGTHKVVSKKYLPSYLDAFVWHYNNRHNDRKRFSSLLGALLHV